MILFLRVVPGLSIALYERDHPESRSYPTAVARWDGRGLISEVNMLASYYGVRPGMTTAAARQHCPDIRILPADPARIATVGEEIYTVLCRFSPRVQPLEPGEVVCDLSGCERQWRDWGSLARSAGIAVREATGISASIGIGVNRLVAELASSTAGPGSVTIIEEGRERGFLANLPLTALPEMDPTMALTFGVLGLNTVGQFASLPAAAVRNRFGAAGDRLHRYARGIDPRPVTPPVSKPAISARYECEDGTPEEALEGLRRLAIDLGNELQTRNLQARVVTLRLWWKAPSAPPPSFPIPYRIHSYALPQPTGSSCEGDSPGHLAHPSRARRERPEGLGYEPIPYPEHHLAHIPSPTAVGEGAGGEGPPRANLDTTSALVRTPIDAEGPLAERAQHLLLERLKGQGGEHPPLLASIELEVSEFARPEQGGFAELDLIGETGGLRGMSPERWNALVHSDEAWTARHGATAFRHIAAVDPANVVTERRVQWAEGLRAVRRRR